MKIQKYNEIHDKIIELKKSIEMSFIKLGAMLKQVRDNKLYLEHSCQTFEEYIAQPELSLNRSTVYAVIGVYEDFFESNQTDVELAEVGYTKLDRIRQFKNADNFDEWIYKAKTLSLSDLGAEIRETKDTKKVKVEKVQEVTCPKCGYRFEILK